MTEQLPIAPAVAPALRHLAAVCDVSTRTLVETAFGASGATHSIVIDGGVDAATAYIAATAPPEFVLVDISNSADPLASIEALADQCASATPVIVVGEVNDITLYRALIEAGVSDYLVKPLDPPRLGAAVATALAQARLVSGTARVVVLIGARGGVGTTTLALSAGWTLAQAFEQRIVLLDLDLHFGSMALLVDQLPGNGLRELLASPERIDATLIAAALIRPTGEAAASNRMALLAGEVPLEAETGGSGADVAALLAALSTSADTIIVDLPRTLDASARALLRTADCVAIVSSTDLAGLRDTQRLSRLVAGLRAGDRPLVIVNRLGREGAGLLSEHAFQTTLGSPIDIGISEDLPGATRGASTGLPLAATASTSRHRTQWRNLAALLGGERVEAAVSNSTVPALGAFKAIFRRLRP